MTSGSSQPPAPSSCALCGSVLPPGTPPGRCPRCLLGAALGGAPTAPAEPGINRGVRDRYWPLPGDVFGGYRINGLLGEGGMGAVFDAQEAETGRRVALKVLSQSLDSPEARDRFFREGRLAASINHPNSVYVFGTEEVAGNPVIVMELVAGGTLQERIRTQGPMRPEEAVDAILQVIAGLEAAHRVGILHRDIKPSNCFLGSDGTVKIGDFGLSISTSVRIEPSLTATGVFLGTPAFCSPEQLRGEELTVRSDLYSVGATLFFLLTGSTPFEGKNVVQLLATVLEQPAPSPRKVRPTINRGLAAVVQRCLQKQPGDRFRNYRELAAALAPYSSTAPTPATLGLRFVAGVIDMLLLGAAGAVFMWAAVGSPLQVLEAAQQSPGQALKWVIPWMSVTLLYYAVLEGTRGRTLGKKLCRLRVIGPDNNPPGFARALGRSAIYTLLPALPYWAMAGLDPRLVTDAGNSAQILLSLTFYLILGLLFSTARARNGYAALHDLATGTRLIASGFQEHRPMLEVTGEPSPSVREARRIGPYHVLQQLPGGEGSRCLLGYDLRLLRRVWIRFRAAGDPRVPEPWRTLARPGRLRWLGDRRSPEENWDAYEAPDGQPLAGLVRQPQPWARVRFWLFDLAKELEAAARDGTLPATTGLDQVWVTGDGRAKLLDFPAPGAIVPELAGNTPPLPLLQTVATSALHGWAADGKAAPPAPLPLHARAFLEWLRGSPGPGAVADRIKPLLARASSISRARRAAMAAGCVALPVLAVLMVLLTSGMVKDWERANPGLMELNGILHARRAAKWFPASTERPTDEQYRMFIASRYREMITNSASWKSPFAKSLIQGEGRRFAEESVAQYPDLSAEQMAEVSAAIHEPVFQTGSFDFARQPQLLAGIFAAALGFYVGLPSLLAALLFKGGFIQRAANVAYVRRDGAPAGRVRVFWRALVNWGGLALTFSVALLGRGWLGAWTAGGLVALLALGVVVLSLSLPRRGIADRLAGTWPVPR